MTTTPLCGARTRQGGTCRKPPMDGTTRCKLHGGASPNAQRLAVQRRAERELLFLGIPVTEIHPADAIVQLVHYQAAIVNYWRGKVNDLNEDDLTWGRTKEKVGGDDQGITSEAKPNIAYALLVQAQDKLAEYAAAALRAGVEERRVRLAESQGQLVAQAIRSVLDALNLSPAQLELVPTVVPAALRLIAGEVA